jgi:DNA polymerase elongation subunit (family B)
MKKVNEHRLPADTKPKLVHIASQITSLARITLLRAAYKLQHAGATLIYCDTDSLVFKSNGLNKEARERCYHEDPSQLGAWKVEHQSPRVFQAFAPKLYYQEYDEEETGRIIEIFKSKGLHYTKEKLEDMRAFFQSLRDNGHGEWRQL